MPRIIAMQADVFSGEQGIPSEDIDAFMAKGPICWRAGSDGKLYAAAAAWKENDEIHWGRFGVFPAARGLYIGTGLIRSSFAEMLHEGVDKIYMDARDAG
ncbi:GNAT family N-acetyltransferase [uncultured Oscillibacter sp.]|uniref:GNAT family N-acetyltransferase n=1 Tax=uncultured Oscillibacter sp. TaxID=876091 RepID=UPI0025E69DB9|nr:GNAT family N-acetyltransferase [uncultured Oscillibacter sp.]